MGSLCQFLGHSQPSPGLSRKPATGIPSSFCPGPSAITLRKQTDNIAVTTVTVSHNFYISLTALQEVPAHFSRILQALFVIAAEVEGGHRKKQAPELKEKIVLCMARSLRGKRKKKKKALSPKRASSQELSKRL